MSAHTAASIPAGERTLQISPQLYARIGGALYLIIILTGLFGEVFVRNGMIVSADAAATAHNIAASPLLWRLGILGDLVMHICDVPLMLILYVLLRPVEKDLARLYLLFTLTQTCVLVASKLSLLMPLFLSSGAAYLGAFEPKQLDALTYLSLRVDAYGFGVGLIFFGCACLVMGHLIARSEFLPRIIGRMIQIAGACYLVNSFALILAPPIANMLFPAIMIPPLIGETSLCLWLLVKGVDVGKWEARARAC